MCIFGLLSFAINIVSFDVPFPANYGGVIDVYYKLAWFKKMNVDVYLHCFAYGRKESTELEALCKKVYYYPRKTGITANFSSLPYTVKSRQSQDLEKNLLANDFPILFEVLHTCYLLKDERFKGRIKIYRHSNIEHTYYRHLAKVEKSFLKKMYLGIEANKLEKFEPIVNHADYIFAVNEDDVNYFRKKHTAPETFYIPSFHPNDEVNIKPGKGGFVLYHGNLSVAENYEAAEWLIQHVFSKITHHVIIAGLNPPQFLKEKIKPYGHIRLIENPGEEEMKDLVENAHVHCLYTAQATGLKLKLLNVLFRGRFVVTNQNMLAGTGFSANQSMLVSEKMLREVNNCFGLEFSIAEFEARKAMLENFSNEKNMNEIIRIVFNSN